MKSCGGIPRLRGPTRQNAARKRKSGRCARDDNLWVGRTEEKARRFFRGSSGNSGQAEQAGWRISREVPRLRRWKSGWEAGRWCGKSGEPSKLPLKIGAGRPQSKGNESVCRGVLTDTNGLLCGAGAVSSLGGAGPSDWKGNANEQRHGP
jgi:hypothetical protein